MEERSELAESPEYKSFRSTVPKRIVDVGYRGKEYTWKIYDYGPKEAPAPVLFFPPVSSPADVFFQQVVSLTNDGCRCIAMDYPVTWNVEEFVGVTLAFLRQFRLTKVHLVGASLGAFLAQKLAEYTQQSHLVQSLVLINGFTDTTAFKSAPSPYLVQFMPAFMLKRILLSNFPEEVERKEVADSIDFVVEQMDLLTQSELASRFNLNTKPSFVNPHAILDQHIPVMIMEVQDKCALSSSVRLEMTKYYPDARVAHLKNGGNFPYLAVSSEVDMFLRVHLRQFLGTPSSPCGDEETNERFRNVHSAGEGSTASDAEPSAPETTNSRPRRSHGHNEDDDDENDDDETF